MLLIKQWSKLLRIEEFVMGWKYLLNAFIGWKWGQEKLLKLLKGFHPCLVQFGKIVTRCWKKLIHCMRYATHCQDMVNNDDAGWVFWSSKWCKFLRKSPSFHFCFPLLVVLIQRFFFFFRSLRLVIYQTFLVSKNLYGVAIMVEQCLVTCLCLSYWESRCVSYGDGFVTCFIATICNTSYVVYCLLYFSESVAISEWMMLQFIEFVM